MSEVTEYMSLNVSETQFESDIEADMLRAGYRKVDRTLYDKASMLFPSVLVEFIKSTQPREWTRYERYYGDQAVVKLIRRFNDSVASRGLLDVLKNGLEDMGIKLFVCYFKPDSTMNAVLNDKYSKNIIGITRQFPYSLQNNNEIDMVISVNGIPVFAFELKDQFKNQNYECAIEQWKEDRDFREPIFKFEQRFFAYFAVDLYEVWMTTELLGAKTEFRPFNQGSNGPGKAGGAGNPENDQGYPTDYLWKRVFQKDSVMDLIRRFITVIEEKKEEKVNGQIQKKLIKKIIFPRFHQYDVVHKILDDVKENGSGRNYLIEHSAGSGKSNSIAWVAYRLASVFKDDEEPIFDTVIVVTNRIVLDSQLQDTINSFDHKAGLIECITQKKGSKGLIDAVNDKKRIVICTVQKFLYAYKDFENIKGRNFAVIIDEAHQGESGESFRTLRKSLTDLELEARKYCEEMGIEDPNDLDENDDLVQEILAQGHHDNQSFFAFTATPIGKTLQTFGTKYSDGTRHPFHTYSMKQAIEEGYILDVLKDYMTVEQAFSIAKKTEENPELIEQKAKRALFRYYKEHDLTISQKVDLIMDNFLHNGRLKINGHGKAMVICDSRENAVKFYFAIKEYIKEHKQECQGCDALVAFSGTVKLDGDDTEYVEVKMNRDKDCKLISSDRKLRAALHSDDFNILVVANKYQTGYDEPLLHSMYVDKKLKGVNAVQTLSRLNRVCRDKEDTFVLDFENTAELIKKSFAPFYAETTLQADMDLNHVYDLRSKVNSLGLFTTKQIDEFIKVMESQSAKKKQDSSAVGKIASIIKPVVDAYKELDEEHRYLSRDTMMKFTRCYAFVTQLVRIADKDLFKDYLFVSHVVHLLPTSGGPAIDLSGKISLEYTKLTEKFHGAIKLEEGTGFKPVDGNPKTRIKKVNTLQRIIEKINEQFGQNIGSADAVAIESVTKMLLDDSVVQTKLKEYAKTNDANMFIKSIFPAEFQRVLVECFMKNDEAFNKLLNDSQFQKVVMNVMAKEMYKTLVSDKPEEND